MNDPVPDQRLEAELRAMLQRRALDMNPDPPAWRDLAQRTGAVVISLQTGAPVDPDTARGRRGHGRQWFRPVLAAAVALVVAMVSALVVGGSGPGHGDTADGPEAIDVPAAGQRSFDPARATPLFPVTDDASPDLPPSEWLGDATKAASEYLDVMGLPVGQDWLVIDPAVKDVQGNGDAPPIQTANVAWSIHADRRADLPLLAEGTVFLRNAERGGRNTWFVVGVSTRKLWLSDIHRDGDLLSFDVDRTSDGPNFPQAAAISVDGVIVGSVDTGEIQQIRVQRPAGQVAVIQVQHMVDGVPWSITSTAVPALPGGAIAVPDAEPPVPTTIIRGDSGVSVTVEPGFPVPPSTVDPTDPTDPVESRRMAVSRR
jgi:hypothetical protein